MKYAVIQTGGKQYKISEGETILVDRLPGKKGENFHFSEVLLLRKDEQVFIGEPFLENWVVKAKILAEEVKGKKITVAKFKSKVRYRRKKGFRPVYSQVLIEKIEEIFSSGKKHQMEEKKKSN